MDHVEAMSEGEWNNFGGMYSSATNEEADFMAQLLGNCSLPSGSTLAATARCSWPVHESNMDMVASVHEMDESSIFSSSNNECENHSSFTNMNYYFSQGNNSSGTSRGSVLPSSSYHQEGYYHPTTSMSMMDYFVLEPKNTNHYLMGAGDDDLNQDVSNDEISMDYSNENKHIIAQFGLNGMVNLQLGREYDMPDVPKSSSSDELSAELAKKRPRTPVANVEKNKRIVKPKKTQKLNPKLCSSGDDEGGNSKPIFQRQDSVLSRTSIEVDSNASQDINGGATSSSCPKGDGVLNLSGKARASRGAATDPQSLYARKRRERINERLKVLQTLVPNGTKVDISTMLEEAVQYVKFLQLQIKLLSSDDMWMYAPIAYNGMDIGLLQKINASSTT